jgi:hypothetical protein
MREPIGHGTTIEPNWKLTHRVGTRLADLATPTLYAGAASPLSGAAIPQEVTT